MKKIILFFISIVILEASSSNIQTDLVGTIVKIFFPEETISVFIDDENYQTTKKTTIFNLSSTCQDATFYIIKNIDNYINNHCFNQNAYILTTNYQDYKKHKNVLGAIFWQKGRLNLIFRKKRLDELYLHLPNKYNKYIE